MSLNMEGFAPEEKLRSQCWDKAFYDFATSYIFIRIGKRYKRKILALTFLGIIVPVIVGAIFLSFVPSQNIASLITIIASIMLIAQLILSVWSIIAQWNDKYSYSLESVSANDRLSRNFKTLAENPPSEYQTFQIKYEYLKLEDDFRNDLDSKQLVSEKDKRYGHRAALRQFQKGCSGCSEIPQSLKPTKCNICGNF